MPKHKKSLKNFIIFWVIALLALFGWYNYLMANDLHLQITLSLLAGVVLGTLVYVAAEFLSKGKDDVREATIRLTDIYRLIEQLNESLKQAIKKAEPVEPAVEEFHNEEINDKIRHEATPEEVKERLSRLLRGN